MSQGGTNRVRFEAAAAETGGLQGAIATYEGWCKEKPLLTKGCTSMIGFLLGHHFTLQSLRQRGAAQLHMSVDRFVQMSPALCAPGTSLHIVHNTNASDQRRGVEYHRFSDAAVAAESMPPMPVMDSKVSVSPAPYSVRPAQMRLLADRLSPSRWWRARGRRRRAISFTRFMVISCAPAIPRFRSSSWSSGCATDGAFRPAACARSSTASPLKVPIQRLPAASPALAAGAETPCSSVEA